MNLINKDNWKKLDGTWIVDEDRLIQSNEKGGLTTRIYQLIDSSNFIASYKMKLTRINTEVWGESKFIFSDANSTEDFRIDFLYTLNLCRLTIGTVLNQHRQISTICELIEGQEYAIKISLKDNLLSVFVDGMKIFDNFNVGLRSNKLIGFGSWDSTVEFSEIKITAYKIYKCFVVMPFDYQRNFLYEYVIKPTLDKHPKYLIEHDRGDESLTVGKISKEINDFINNSNIIIADITNKNPNVFYELGLAHSKNRKALLLIEKKEGEKEEIPFDIIDFRWYKYHFSKDGFEEVSKAINSVFTNIIDELEYETVHS